MERGNGEAAIDRVPALAYGAYARIAGHRSDIASDPLWDGRSIARPH